jgi:hypothetical protein
MSPYRDERIFAKYDGLCQVLDPPLRCLPAVFSDSCGIGRELYSAMIQPHFEQLYKAKVAEGKSGWAARMAKQRLFRHTSVTVANGNFHILATAMHWSRGASPGCPAHGPNLNPQHWH